jgi:hypothetical protein
MQSLEPMKVVAAAVMLALLPGPVASEENWLEIIKSENGFLFSGPGDNETFSFDVPGELIRTTEDSGRAFAAIDGAVVQVLRVPLSLFPGGDKLGEHEEYESKSLQASGVRVSPSAFCSKRSFPHREWRAELPGVSVSRYLTFPTKRSIIVVVVSANSESSAKVAKKQLEGICASIKL